MIKHYRRVCVCVCVCRAHPQCTLSSPLLFERDPLFGINLSAQRNEVSQKNSFAAGGSTFRRRDISLWTKREQLLKGQHLQMSPYQWFSKCIWQAPPFQVRNCSFLTHVA